SVQGRTAWCGRHWCSTAASPAPGPMPTPPVTRRRSCSARSAIRMPWPPPSRASRTSSTAEPSIRHPPAPRLDTMRSVSTYFLRQSETAFEPTEHVGGAWNPDELHIAPVLGLLAHLVEADHAARRPEAPLVIARASYDILGVIPMNIFEISVRVVRPGRTIELVEAMLSQAGRPAVALRAWMLQQNDTAAMQGSPLPHMALIESFAPWSAGDVWAGGAIRSIDARREAAGTGRARCWIRPQHPLLEGETVSARARMLGMLDFANGIATRVPPETAF